MREEHGRKPLFGMNLEKKQLFPDVSGYGGCMLANIKRDELMKVLNISDEYKIDLCLALGKPKEEVVIDVISGDGDIKYYRDENQVQHVPKKSLEDIIL